MKTILNFTLALILVALSACQLGRPATPVVPGNATPTAGAPTNGLTPAGGSGRPTTEPVAARADYLPAFPNLYWTEEVGVTLHGERAADLSSPLACDALLSLLVSGEWRLTEKAAPDASLGGMGATLASLALGDQVALVTLKPLGQLDLPEDGMTPTAVTALPGEAAYAGCMGSVEILPLQPVSAAGAETFDGQARQMPVINGCTFSDGVATVSYLYEGPGDFRASLQFSVPVQAGEHPVNVEDAELSIFHDEASLVAMIARSYAQVGADEEEADEERDSYQPGSDDAADEESGDYQPGSEDAGVITVTSVDPLAGEVRLSGWLDASGAPQDFRAGFSCLPAK